MNFDNIMLKEKQERLKRIEESLRLSGAVKCKICNYWVDNSYIDNGVCNCCRKL